MLLPRAVLSGSSVDAESAAIDRTRVAGRKPQIDSRLQGEALPLTRRGSASWCLRGNRFR